MAKTTPKNSDPVHIRYKPLKNGRKSIYLDYCVGSKRKVEYLKLYLEDGSTKEIRQHNESVMRCALNIKSERLKNFAHKRDIDYGIDRSRIFLLDWIDRFVEDRKRKGVHSAVTNYPPAMECDAMEVKDIGTYNISCRFWCLLYGEIYRAKRGRMSLCGL